MSFELYNTKTQIIDLWLLRSTIKDVSWINNYWMEHLYETFSFSLFDLFLLFVKFKLHFRGVSPCQPSPVNINLTYWLMVQIYFKLTLVVRFLWRVLEVKIETHQFIKSYSFIKKPQVHRNLHSQFHLQILIWSNGVKLPNPQQLNISI